MTLWRLMFVEKLGRLKEATLGTWRSLIPRHRIYDASFFIRHDIYDRRFLFIHLPFTTLTIYEITKNHNL